MRTIRGGHKTLQERWGTTIELEEVHIRCLFIEQYRARYCKGEGKGRIESTDNNVNGMYAALSKVFSMVLRQNVRK